MSVRSTCSHVEVCTIVTLEDSFFKNSRVAVNYTLIECDHLIKFKPSINAKLHPYQATKRR